MCHPRCQVWTAQPVDIATPATAHKHNHTNRAQPGRTHTRKHGPLPSGLAYLLDTVTRYAALRRSNIDTPVVTAAPCSCTLLSIQGPTLRRSGSAQLEYTASANGRPCVEQTDARACVNDSRDCRHHRPEQRWANNTNVKCLRPNSATKMYGLVYPSANLSRYQAKEKQSPKLSSVWNADFRSRVQESKRRPASAIAK